MQGGRQIGMVGLRWSAAGVLAVLLCGVALLAAGVESATAAPSGLLATVTPVRSVAGASVASTCGPASAGQIAVVLVVDRGSGAPSVRCALLSQGATGLDALRAAGHQVRLDGGFVCGIDGLPTTGCGNRPDAGLAYWRYWHAAPGSAWTYSQVGAGGYRLPLRCAVEGWVWSDSASADTPPSTPPPTPTCEAPATTVPVTAPAWGPSGSGTASGGEVVPASPPAEVDGATATPGADTAGRGAETSSSAGGSGSRRLAGGAAADSSASGDRGDPGANHGSGGVAGDGADGHRAGGHGADRNGAGNESTGNEGTGNEGTGKVGSGGESALGAGRAAVPDSLPWGTVIALVLIAGLGCSAALVARSRRRSAQDA